MIRENVCNSGKSLLALHLYHTYANSGIFYTTAGERFLKAYAQIVYKFKKKKIIPSAHVNFQEHHNFLELSIIIIIINVYYDYIVL